MRRALLAAMLLLAGCQHGSSAAPPDLGPDLGPPAQKTKVDVLFVLGNEPSPAGQREAIQAAPYLFRLLETHPASYHFGVISPDLGAGRFTLGNCHPGGDGAKLQARGVTSDPSCQPPTGGMRFVDDDPLAGTNNLPSGQDLATTFACMASVGNQGCGFQQPLEAAYRALHDPIPENAGFLRDDALLVVVFVVDKDDCSLPADSDLADSSDAGVAMYGPLSSSRCYFFGVACGDPARPLQPADSNGPLSMCRPLEMAEGGKLVDVQKYVDYFTRPPSKGGVKADPRDVVLAAIAPPPDPVSVSITNLSPTGREAVVNPSCELPNTSLFGDPTVRLTPVVQSAATSQLTTVCALSYQSQMQSLGELIVSRVQ